jgi:hypothetical protein
MRSFHDVLEIRPASLFLLLGWSLICPVPDYPIHVVGFVGDDSGVIKLDVMVM